MNATLPQARRGTEPAPRTATFGGLAVGWDPRVLEPRPWTLAQARWAVELAGSVAPGPILDLCSGVGHVGIEVARRTRRPVVQVDVSEVACRWARANADRAGVGDLVEVRCADLDGATRPGDRFALVVADPPYIPTRRVGDFPLDPPLAIDGGPDGTALVWATLEVGSRHLPPGGPLLLQLGGPAQVVVVVEALARGRAPAGLRLDLTSVQLHGPDRALVLFRRGA